jgi:hypothetical protein
MEIIKTQKKGIHLNTLEKYHIYKASKNGIHMNDAHTDVHNPIFEILQEINTSINTKNQSNQRSVTSTPAQGKQDTPQRK